ncbi:MAG: hypothetical protein AAGC53_17500 [Actinomycetota bacterium]
MSESPKPTSVKKSVLATAVVASTLGGVAAGAAFFTPAIAGAQDDADGTTVEENAGPSRLEEALQPLVDDGTINESQRDAVVDTLEAARPERSGERGQRGPRGGGFGNLAETLGVDGAEIREAIQNGDSIADIAEAQGIDLDSVVDSLIDGAEERLDAAVEAGRIDADQAAEMLAQAEEKANDIVNGEFEFGDREGRRGPGGRGFGGPGGFGPGGDADGGDTDTSA